MMKVIALSVILALFLWNCAYNIPSDSEGTPVPYSSMIKLQAKGKTVTLGSNDSLAKEDEKPAMDVSFTYDFYIDTTEVTIQDYHSLTGKIPAGLDTTLGSRRLPVVNISWFDAALYCNARSRRDNLDTVYFYTDLESTVDGKVYRLENLKTDFLTNGYRLPTESEWEFAARCGTNCTFPWGEDTTDKEADCMAWYASNSGNKTHPVAQKKQNTFGLYDMLGNVMEWVNDNKGTFKDTTIVNFVGLSNSESDLIPVKGGSYKHGIEYLRPGSRSDIYEITSSTVVPYIGFRCAAGIIPTATNISEDTTLPLKPQLIAYSPLGFALTNEVKLVFVNRKNSVRILSYIDYNESIPQIHSFEDIRNVYHPTISPDGQFVAFCTNGEGLEANSTIFIRRLDPKGSGLIAVKDKPAFIPRWWYDPQTGDTVIVYTDRSTLNSRPHWRSTKTKKIVIKGGRPIAGMTSIICNDGSYHGGLTADGNYLATGYSHLKIRDNTTHAMKILFTGPNNGKSKGDTSQVCNVSVVQSSPVGEILFLDFGYRDTSTLVGRPYGVHEILFLSNFSGKVQRWFEPPQGYSKWDHPECTNQPGVAIASVTNTEGRHPKVYVLNLENNSRSQLVSGEDLLHPYLWIGNPVNTDSVVLNIDSLGKYNEPPSHVSQKNLAMKMPSFWRLAGSLEIVLIGNSRMQHGVNPLLLSRKNCYNLAYGGCALKGSVEMITNYVLNHCPKIKLIAMSLHIGMLSRKDGDVTWTTGPKKTFGYNYDVNHNFWCNGLPNFFLTLIEKAENLGEYPNFGYGARPSRGWGSPTPTATYTNWDINHKEYIKNLNTIKALAQILAQKEVHFIIVIFPMTPHFRSTDHYGLYGPSTETARKIIDELKLYCERSPYAHFYDSHNYGVHDYIDRDAYNLDHLAHNGAVKFTRRFDTLISEILQTETNPF